MAEDLSIEDLLEEADHTAAAQATESVKKTKAKKERAPSTPRISKGEWVRFQNKAGQTITGIGVHYFVVRFKGKLHYKEASAVTILPPDWKEGDALPVSAAVPDELPDDVDLSS